MEERRIELRTVRRCVLAAVVLDTVALGSLLSAISARQELVVAFGVPLLVAGLLAVRFPRLGLVLAPVRTLEFIFVLIGGLIDPWLYGAGALALAALVTGLIGTLRPSLPLGSTAGLRCSQCDQPVADPMMAGRKRRPLCRSCAWRRDEIWLAVLHVGLVVLVGAA